MTLIPTETILTDTYKELKFHLNKMFQRQLYDNSYIDSFYNEVEKHIPQKSDTISKDLQNFYDFKEISKRSLEGSINDNDSEIFQNTLYQILEETKYILNQY